MVGIEAMGHPVTDKHAGRCVRVTREMVARKARVSLATVTYALSGSNKIRLGKSTCERVQRIARQMGYRPNYVYRTLSSKRTYTVGLLVPDAHALRFQFYDRMVEGALSAMNRADYDPLLLLYSNWPRVEKVINDGRLDGIIMIQSSLDEGPAVRMGALNIPLVLMNRVLPGAVTGVAACVYSDHDRMIRSAVKELLYRGCRSLLNFSEPRSTFAGHRTYESFCRVLDEHAGRGISGQTLQPEWKGMRPVARGVFESAAAWDGVFVNGWPLVESLLVEAGRRGLAAGKDFQLVSTDAYRDELPYDPGAERKRPEQTVFYQQPEKVGARAWEIMQGLLDGKPTPRETLIPYREEKQAEEG